MKRHILFIYIAALLMMLGTALPMSAQNKSFTVNRNDGASQKYSYSQGDRLVLSREDSQGKKHADFVEQQVYVGNAVHNIPLASIESITFDTQATEDEGKSFTIQESGGKIEYGDITIDFLSGTFNSDVEVSIAEVSANDVAGGSACSKFYKIKLPTTGTKKSLKININSADNTGNIGMVAQSKGWSMHTGITGNYLFPLDFEKEADTFTGIIGPFDDAESEHPWFSVGLMKMTMAEVKSGTRAGQEDISRFKAFWPGRDDELAKKAVELLNDYIPKELSMLKELGFELPFTKPQDDPLLEMQEKLKYFVVEYDDPTWGDFIYPSYVTNNGYIRVKASNIEKLMKDLSNVDNNNQLKQTLIHETLHAVDFFTYEPRSTYMTSFLGQYGDEWATLLGEALGSWVEKFTGSMKVGENTYTYASNFMTEFFPRYKSKDIYTAAGYGMGLFIEYLSRKTDNKKIKTLLDYKRNGLSWFSSGKGAKTVREAFNLFLSENKLQFFNSVDYWNFAYDVLKGNIDERVNYEFLSDLSLIKEKDEYVFYDDINNYGIVAHRLKLNKKLLNDNKDESIEIGQYEDNIQTKIFFVNDRGELELVKEVKKDDSYLINVDKLLNDNILVLMLVNTRIENEENTDRIKSFVKVKVFGDAIVKTDPSELTFDADGGDKFLEVITSQPKYKVEKDVGWLKTLAWVDFTVRVTADPNTSSTERKGTLTIYALDANGNQVGQPAKVEVTQKGMFTKIEVEPSKSLEFEAAGGTVTLTVTTNQPQWSITKKTGDWYNYSTSGNKLTVTAFANPTSDPRDGYLEICALNEKNEKVSEPVTIKVKQKAKVVVKLQMSLHINIALFDGRYEQDLKPIWVNLINDENKTEIVVNRNKDDDRYQVMCKGEDGEISFDSDVDIINDLDRLKSRKVEINNLSCMRDGRFSLVATGSSGNSYKEDENSITYGWDYGSIIYFHDTMTGATLPSPSGKWIVTGGISITRPK